jgi:hypothetical protein
MLLIFSSTFESGEFSLRIVSAPCSEGPFVVVPSMRPPFALPVPDLPTVADAPRADDPVELAVPSVLVPGAVGNFEEFLAPLGSSPELLRPVFAGPGGMPLMDC